MIHRFLVTMVLVVWLSVAGVAAQVGSITGLKGTVQFRPAKAARATALAKGATIAEGNWITTGANGWVELTLNDRSTFTLANNTDFEVTKFLLSSDKREGTFSLAQGTIRASVVKLAGRQSGMTVKSGTVVAGVKGTEFMMMSQGQANVLFGNEGTVGVSGDGSGPEQPLTAGTMTENTRGITPLEPLTVESGSPLAEARDLMRTVTAATPPAEWNDSGRIKDIIARWNINYGHYLADSGKYAQALHVFQIALDLSTIAAVRADARLERGTVYARFLNKPVLALDEYQALLDEYPDAPQAETALYSAAQALSETGAVEQARKKLGQYLKKYPAGKHVNNVEMLLMGLEKNK